MKEEIQSLFTNNEIQNFVVAIDIFSDIYKKYS
jgi:hypothetical protein